MERVVNLFSEGPSALRCVAVCVQRVGLSGPTAVLLPEPPVSQLLAGGLIEIWVAPHKPSADVVLARAPTDDSVRAWIEDAAGQDPRPIRQSPLGPTAAQRWRLLSTHPAQQWASAGGLRVVGAQKQGPGWLSRTFSIPPGVPPDYFNVAPVDQQVGRITGSEVVWIDSPAGRRASRLPGVEATVWAVDASSPEVVPMTLDTVVIDPDTLEALLFWRGSFQRAADAPVATIVAEALMPGAVRPPPPPRSAPSEAPRPPLKPMPTREIAIEGAPFNETTSRVVDASDPALPFKKSFPPAAPEPAPEPWEPPGNAVIARPAMLQKLKDHFGEADDPGLYETQNAASEAPVGATPAALPFRAGNEGTHEIVPPVRPATVSSTTSPVAVVSAAPVMTQIQGILVPPAMVPPPVPFRPVQRPSFEIARSEAELRPPDLVVVPPPVIADGVPVEVEAEPSTQPHGPSELTIEVVATVDAEMQIDPDVAKKTLDGHALSLPDFASRRTTFTDAMAAETKRGRRDTQQRYDEVYLDRVEELRGKAISVAEYARIVVSIERLNVEEVFEDLKLPVKGQLVITRVFAARSAKSPELRREILNAIREARG